MFTQLLVLVLLGFTCQDHLICDAPLEPFLRLPGFQLYLLDSCLFRTSITSLSEWVLSIRVTRLGHIESSSGLLLSARLSVLGNFIGNITRRRRNLSRLLAYEIQSSFIYNSMIHLFDDLHPPYSYRLFVIRRFILFTNFKLLCLLLSKIFLSTRIRRTYLPSSFWKFTIFIRRITRVCFFYIFTFLVNMFVFLCCRVGVVYRHLHFGRG